MSVWRANGVCACPTGTIDPARGYASDRGMHDVPRLPASVRGGQTFIGHLRPAPRQPYDLSRRRFLAQPRLPSPPSAYSRRTGCAERPAHPPGAQSPQFAARASAAACASRPARPLACVSLSEGEPVRPGPRSPRSATVTNRNARPGLPDGPSAAGSLRSGKQSGHAYIDRSRCLPGPTTSPVSSVKRCAAAR